MSSRVEVPPARRGPKAKRGVQAARQSMYRGLVLEAAERVFGEKGYDGTKMQDIAGEAGLALATVYATIPGKEEVYAAVHELRGRALLERAAAAAAGAKTALEAISLGIEAYVAFLVEHRSYLRIHLLESQPWALEPRFTCAEQRRQWREGLELSVLVFRNGIAEGSVRAGDATLYAKQMIAAHQVFLAHWVEGGMRQPRADLVAEMRGFVERAFAP